jgi:hypothetical protein
MGFVHGFQILPFSITTFHLIASGVNHEKYISENTFLNLFCIGQELHELISMQIYAGLILKYVYRK